MPLGGKPSEARAGSSLFGTRGRGALSLLGVKVWSQRGLQETLPASPTLGDVSQDQSECLWQRVSVCPQPVTTSEESLERMTTAGVPNPLPAPVAFPTRGPASWEDGWAYPHPPGWGWELGSCSWASHPCLERAIKMFQSQTRHESHFSKSWEIVIWGFGS